MSRKGTTSVYSRSKQIPRIFQRQRTATNARSWLTSLIPEDGISLREQSVDQTHYDLIPGPSYDYYHVQQENEKKDVSSRSTTMVNNKEFIEKTWNDESCQVFLFCFHLFSSICTMKFLFSIIKSLTTFFHFTILFLVFLCFVRNSRRV